MGDLVAKMSKEQMRALQSTSCGMYSKAKRADGSTQVTGGKRLKSSGAYPPNFGKKVAKLFKKGLPVPWVCLRLIFPTEMYMYITIYIIYIHIWRFIVFQRGSPGLKIRCLFSS